MKPMDEPKKKAYPFTAKRRMCVQRDKNGRFFTWKGGADKSDLKKRKNNYHGVGIHIGFEFKKQHQRTAKPGDVLRKKTANGDYHEGSYWYVKTPVGWRNTGLVEKPSPEKIKQICRRARKGKDAKIKSRKEHRKNVANT